MARAFLGACMTARCVLPRSARRDTIAILTGFARCSAFAADIQLDLSSLGVPYEGVGALSGGGGDTRLLVDYPPAAQEAILDALFKPNAGASLQYIKVEIGGDAQSTEVSWVALPGGCQSTGPFAMCRE